MFDYRKLETKKKQLGRLEEQLHKLEVQATDKVHGCWCVYVCVGRGEVEGSIVYA